MHPGGLLAVEPSAAIEGFAYRPDFISPAEEAALLDSLKALAFAEAKFQQYVARRRVVSYGASYDYGAQALQAAPPIPAFLSTLQERAAAWLGVPAAQLAYALINEYRPGTPLGWHRDRGEFGLVAGISLGGRGRMRFRHYPPVKREKALAIDLEPRSAYVLRDAARWGWQHSIPPTPELRYSITFRTLRTP